MQKKILALCDSEKEYLESLADYIGRKEEQPFELHTYSRPEGLLEFAKEKEIELLLVAESDYTYEVAALPTGQTLLLNESGIIQGENVPNISKYQKAENLWRELLGYYADHVDERERPLKRSDNTAIIGLYSPIRRCLQTSLALTLGQALAEQKKVLYVSFEHYAGWNQLLDKSVKGDLAALLYFAEEGEEKFSYRLQSMTMQIGKLFYIPPVYTGQNLIFVTAQEWRKLITRIAGVGGYDFILLDLSESIQGTYELLRMCDKIYTIIREDERARSKVAQYEELLRDYEYEDVLHKTEKKLLPEFTRLPEKIEQYGGGELAEYVRQEIAAKLTNGML